MQALSRQNRAFALDLWGYGDSSKVPNKYSIESYVELMDDFVERLGITDRLTLVGHALGAAVALRFACSRPDLVERIVLVALPLTGRHISEHLTYSDSVTILGRHISNISSYPEVETELRKTDKVALNTVASQFVDLDFANDLEKCPCPVLMIYGDRDLVIRPPNGEYREIRRPKYRTHCVTLENCNHFPMLEQPAQFNRLILDFMQDDGNGSIAPKQYWQRRTR